MKKITIKNQNQKLGKETSCLHGSYTATNLVGFSFLKKVVNKMRIALYLAFLALMVIPFVSWNKEDVPEIGVPDSEIQFHIQG